MEPTRHDDRTDASDQLGARHAVEWTASARLRSRRHRCSVPIKCRSADVPDSADHRQPIGTTGR